MHKLLFASIMMLGFWQSAHADNVVLIQRPVPFNEDADIPGAVKRECKLEEKLPDSIAKYGRDTGIKTEFAAEVASDHAGRVLVMEITSAVADGNSFTGHHKAMSVKGKLYQDGQLVGNFKGRRTSMGGVFGEFKGNCGVLERTSNELGEDIAKWLAAPKMDAKLGDLE
ncbi:hypothetical protein [Dyella tabacisoli]|uniref:DUF4410 domain-containing protein n=1 Tax=Dyella tabacisoli TaxID=2282381 RepID=A0A369UQC9_9GAMM|nr:hypothetical protein [Dyella tabacisoli]RDD82255.1 hypothetical protein DVJ77_07475 [Dyella tabacisoli]